MKNLSVRIEEGRIVITKLSSEASVAKYENHLANFTSYRPGRALSFADGSAFGKIIYAVVNLNPSVGRNGRLMRQSPTAQVTIELLPEFGVQATTVGTCQSGFSKQFTIHFEFEGWRVVGTPKLEYIFTDLIIETGAEKYVQRNLPLAELAEDKSSTGRLREGEALGCG